MTTSTPAPTAPGRSLYPTRNAVMTLLRDVAVHADRYRPERVTMGAWNAARADAGHPQAPTAHSIHQRLNRQSRAPVPWRQMLTQATHQQPAQVAIAAFAEDKAKHLGERHVAYALGLVARELDRKAFFAEDYEKARAKLVKSARHRVGDGAALTEVLPTSSQIVRITGTWDGALALAGLQEAGRRKQRVFRRRDSMPVVDAVLLFVKLNGRLPSYPVLGSWARDADISVSAPRVSGKGAWWSEVLDDATAALREVGLSVPAERPKAGRPGKNQNRSYVLPTESVNAAGQGATYWNPERIVESLREWLRTLSAGTGATQGRYRADQRASADTWPSPETVGRHGGMNALLPIAEQRNRLVAQGHPDKFDPLPATADRGHAAREAARAAQRQHDGGHHKRPDGARITVADLLAAELVQPGEQLTGTFKGIAYTATVLADGQLDVAGKGCAPSPSKAEKLACASARNGWRFWRADRDGKACAWRRCGTSTWSRTPRTRSGTWRAPSRSGRACPGSPSRRGTPGQALFCPTWSGPSLVARVGARGSSGRVTSSQEAPTATRPHYRGSRKRTRRIGHQNE